MCVFLGAFLLFWKYKVFPKHKEKPYQVSAIFCSFLFGDYHGSCVPSVLLLCFCLRQSPDHGTLKVVIVGSIFNFSCFEYRHFYKRTFADNMDVMNCANFCIFATSTFCKDVKNDFTKSFFWFLTF